jgi:hypothetical protein
VIPSRATLGADNVQAGCLGGRGVLPFLVDRHSLLSARERATLAQLGVDGGDGVAAVVVSDARAGRCRLGLDAHGSCAPWYDPAR